MATIIDRQRQVKEIEKKRFKSKMKQKSNKKKIRRKLIAFLSLIATLVATLSPIFEGVSAAQIIVNKVMELRVDKKIDKMIEDDKSVPTEKPIGNGDFVAVTEVHPNDEIPEIFSFDFDYDFSDLEGLDEDVMNQLLGHVYDFQSRDWDNGTYDYYTVSLSNLFEEQLKNRDNMSSDEVMEIYVKLINTQIQIHEQARTSLSAIMLAQTEQDYADYLLNVYNLTNNGQINNRCVTYALKSVENFILGLSYNTIEKPIVDILYRMALSYDIVASIENNNIQDICKSLVMSNTLYKLSLQHGYDANHGYMAWYNIGNNYKTLFTILDQHPTFPGYDKRIYYLEKSYENMLLYANNAQNADALRKVSKPMVDICKGLTCYYHDQETKDVHRSKHYYKEYTKWKDFYEKNL